MLPRLAQERAVIVHLRELGDGPRPFPFAVPVEQFDQWVKEADELYFAREAPCEADLTVEKFDDMLFVRGTVSGPMGYACATCLEEEPLDLRIDLKWTLVPKQALSSEKLSDKEELELTVDDLDVSFFEGEEIDLAELVREAILLELDPCPRHDVDACAGRRYLSDPAGEGEEEDPLDPRWAPLAALKDRLDKN